MGQCAVPGGGRLARARLGGRRQGLAPRGPHAGEPRPRQVLARGDEGAPRMKVAALGAGRMGRGIGHVFAYAGFEVDVIDFRPRADFSRLAADAMAEIRGNLRLLADLGLVTDVERIARRVRLVANEDAPAALAAADILFEGVTETEEAKRDAFTRAC